MMRGRDRAQQDGGDWSHNMYCVIKWGELLLAATGATDVMCQGPFALIQVGMQALNANSVSCRVAFGERSF